MRWLALSAVLVVTLGCGKARRDGAGPGLSASGAATPAGAASLPADVPFRCDALALRRAWHFNGESTVQPKGTAELAAFHVTTIATRGFSVELLVNGKVVETPLQRVRSDAAGAPVDRFHDDTQVSKDKLELVLVGAVPKGTQTVTLRAYDRWSPGSLECDFDAHLGDGPAWPPLPRYRVHKMAMRGKRVLLFYRAEHVLPQETPAPVIQRTLESGAIVMQPLPIAVVNVDEKGEPREPDGSADRWLVAEYPWSPESHGETNALPPQRYTTGNDLAPLPAPATWSPSEALDAALREGGRVWDQFGRAGAAVMVHGGRAELLKMADAGVLPPAL
jgi:hypothetical protein